MGYWNELVTTVGQRWNAFWFTPKDALPTSVLRLVAGLLALYFVGSYTSDLAAWFSPDGVLANTTTYRLTGAAEGQVYRFSYLYMARSASDLWLLHAAGLVVLLIYTAGLWTKVTRFLAPLVVLAYVHRAPMLTAQFEPVLTMMLIYLAVTPCGAYLSLDAWRRNRQATADPVRPSFAANLGLRLIQVHLAGFYLMMGLTKLGGETWWLGDATWWLITKSESRIVDLTGLSEAVFLLNAWTHGVVLLELSYGILIWNRLFRPLLIGLSVLSWFSLLWITGLSAYCVTMILANLAFVDPVWLGKWLRRGERAT